jgi:UDP-N-acetylmuramyl tripeptide synthase
MGKPSLRVRTAATLGRAAGAASRALRRGGGTTIPGHVARLVDRHVASSLAAGLRNGCIVVSGTNGKTTTSRLMSGILQAAGHKVVHNRAGANLMTGITAAMLNGGGDIGLFEVDEAALPAAVTELQPRLVLCLNLLRDQLDRYGELNTLAGQWAAALGRLKPAATVLLNADDPLIASLGAGLHSAVRYFSVQSGGAVAVLEHAADSLYCPRCGTLLTFQSVTYGHFGQYCCPQCGFARPEPSFVASDVQLALNGPSRFQMDGLTLETPLPGLYNVYNVLAAAAASLTLGLPPALVAGTVRQFSAAFGRTEIVQLKGRRLRLLLAKNPAGSNAVIRTLLLDPKPLHLYLALNDRIADGEDVSWIWDVDYEQLAGRCQTLIAGGTRAEDLAVRLKYAGFAPADIRLVRGHAEAIQQLMERTPAGGTGYAIPTYTAMLDLRATLAAAGVVRQFWED